MTKFDKVKYDTINKMRALCWRCAQEEDHNCPISRVVAEIEAIRGIPVIVNDELHHVMFV